MMLKFLRISQNNIKAPVNALHPETAMSSGSPLPETPEQESKECCICMDSLARVTLSPCNHSKFCLACISVVFEREKPCPLCRAPIQGGTIDGVESLVIHQEEGGSVGECSICWNRGALVKILPCGDTSFCASCAFTVRSMGRPCPCCRGLITGFDVDPDTRVENAINPNPAVQNFIDILSEDSLRFIDREDIETVGEFADFFNYSIPQIMESFYNDW
jgi:hypothetical protein